MSFQYAGVSGVRETKGKFMRWLRERFFEEESGQDPIEYTLLPAFVALVSASILIGAGNSMNTIRQTDGNSLSGAAVAAS